jgi:hypothetical protein
VFIGIDVGGRGIAYGRTETCKEGFVHCPHRAAHSASILVTPQPRYSPLVTRDRSEIQKVRKVRGVSSLDSPA